MSDSDLQAKPPSENPVERLIQAFGGANALAMRLEVPVATVEGWRTRGAVPRGRLPEIAAAAEKAGIELDAALLSESARGAPTIEGEAQDGREVVETARPQEERTAPGWLRRLGTALPAAALGGVLVIAGFLLAMGTSDLWLGRESEPTQGTAAEDAAAKALDERLAALDKRLSDLDAQVKSQAAQQPTDAQSSGLAVMSQTLNELQQHVAELEQKLGAAGGLKAEDLQQPLQAQRQEILDTVDAKLSQQQAALQKAIADSEAGLQKQLEDGLAKQAEALKQSQTGNQAALALAVSELGERVRGGQPYDGQLSIVEKLAAGDAELKDPLAALAGQAKQGVPTLPALSQQLASLAPQIIGAEKQEGGEDLVADLMVELSGLVSVRPTGEIEGEDAAARIARAEVRLGEGNLQAALDEIKALQGAPAEVAQPWIAAAEARGRSLAALDSLSQLALGRLTAN